ncbi:MAG: glutamine-hydrolyzing GMP synthase [Thermoanaerobaculia bacterium]|nr:glutamine-hydrolyzing GMP synthase [Thermoanaerobaculia bacterium]
MEGRTPEDTEHDRIAVVDFGGQYAHLIATKVRQGRVLAEIRQPEDPIERFEGYKGVILSGSPSLSSHGEDSEYTHEILDLDVPILGFCFGHQEIAKRYGGEVIHGEPEWGAADLNLLDEHPLFAGQPRRQQVWMSHFDSVVSVGPEFRELGYTSLADGKEHRLAAIGSDRLKRYGFQFHPEVDDTEHGAEMIGNFVTSICGCEPSWTMAAYVDEQIERIRRQVGQRSVFLLASGGVDSTVAAKLFELALGPERLALIHIDNGLMRKDECARVVTLLGELGLERALHFVDASDDFLASLDGLVDPEQKRAAIGNTFIEVFERQAAALGLEGHLLGQGTIYPDTIETGGTKRADVIKTHHNRVPLVERMIAEGRVVEPLADLYKPEVRELGLRLGLPRDLVWRHPFPGPGLGVRLLGSDGRQAKDELSALQAAVDGAATPFGLDALVLPIRSVGVKADLRAYEHPVMLSGEAEWDELLATGGSILKQVAGINRCIWNLGPQPPRSPRDLAATTTRERLDLLRAIDEIVMAGLRRHGIYDDIWQCPTVLVPLELDGRGRELVVVRPVHSARAMTARPARLPAALLEELRSRILPMSEVSGLALDVTSKPPGTIEWE